MVASFSDLLAQYARHALTSDALEMHVYALSDAPLAEVQQALADLQTARAQGTIDANLADRLAATLTSAAHATRVGDQATVAQVGRTLVRSPRELISAHDDRTEIKADVTERKPQVDADATQRKEPLSARREADPTLQLNAAAAAAARTLRSDKPVVQTLVRASDDVPATPDRTQIIAERLVKSLDDLGAPVHGPLQAGSVIKQRFVLEKLIGRGGMGLVFAALDRRKQEAQDPNPRVAFKVLNADFQRHPKAFIALQREARKAQTLAHPNVVTVFDFDRDGDAIYMTMELLQGRALEALVREVRGKGVAPEIALPIIRGIAEGLAYAHRKGIVHSDLKPGNVFVLDDGTPKILDFGIARAVPNSIASEVPDVFDAGSLGAYTEAYATDEMVEGIDPHPADDMYALGIIAYELLTGFHPYQRHSAPKARKLGVKPPPLKGLKLREARALERCLSFDRSLRPQDAQAFLKLFRGVTPLQKSLIAATAVLAIAAGALSYQNYRESGPAIPFAQLAQEQQRTFLQSMRDGDAEMSFFERDGGDGPLQSALQHYARAYEIHPRNREASKKLERVADEFLQLAGDDVNTRREVAEYLQLESPFYLRYSPVQEASD